jgi:GT2 family glycosyltransferase
LAVPAEPRETVEPKVGVVVLSYESVEPLRNCLQSILGQSYRNIGTIVVDNGSTDGTIPMVREYFAEVQVCETRANLGVSAVNRGIQLALAAGCEFVFLVDSDCVLDVDLVATLVKVIEQEKRRGIAGSSCYELNRGSAAPLVSVDPRTGLVRTRKYVTEPDETECVGVALVRRTVFEQIGLIDSEYFAYHQDADFSLRARRAGYKVLMVPQARYHHIGAYGTKKVCGLRGYVSLRNRCLLLRKNFAPATYLPFIFNLPLETLRVLGQWARLRQFAEVKTTFVSVLSGVAFLLTGNEPSFLRRIAVSLLKHQIVLSDKEDRASARHGSQVNTQVVVGDGSPDCKFKPTGRSGGTDVIQLGRVDCLP